MYDYTTEQLNNMSKNALVTIIVSQQKQLAAISFQLEYLSSQIALMNQRSFGRKTEKLDQIAGQMNIFEVFNEPEVLVDTSPEPEITEVTISGYTRKKKRPPASRTRKDSLLGSLNISSMKKNWPSFSLTVIRNFRLRFTSALPSSRRPSWWMNTTSMSMRPRTMTGPS